MSGNLENQTLQDDSLDQSLQSLLLNAIQDLLTEMARKGYIDADKLESCPSPKGKNNLNISYLYNDQTKILKLAEEEYRDRRSRETAFDAPNLFGEPAWDMLLDLFISEMHGRKLSVTSVCIGSGVPPTTALRWLKLLEEANLICRELDQNDARRSFVRINQNGMTKMLNYFAKRLALSRY